MKLRVHMKWVEYHSFEIEVPDGTPEDEWEDYAHEDFGNTVHKPVDSECEIDEITVV